MRLFVPGRVCLFGEHSDWAGGYRRAHPHIEKGMALIAGTNQGIYADVGEHPHALSLTSMMSDGMRHGPCTLAMDPPALLAQARRGGFWSYVAGVAYRVLLRHPGVRGLVIDNFRTDLPVQKGLSSSAAMCVLTVRAFNLIYDLGLTTRDEMELAYQGEITTPSRCGRMDQGCAFGRRSTLMAFDGDLLETTEVCVEGEFPLVVVDLCSRKDTTEILARLHRSFPIPATQIDRGVHALLGPINQRVVREAVAALRAGDREGLGSLMSEAQELFDRYAMPACPEELTAPVLHRVLRCKALQPHIWGGKGVGSQGDGSAQLLARSAEDRQAVIELVERELGMTCLQLDLHRVDPGGG